MEILDGRPAFFGGPLAPPDTGARVRGTSPGQRRNAIAYPDGPSGFRTSERRPRSSPSPRHSPCASCAGRGLRRTIRRRAHPGPDPEEEPARGASHLLPPDPVPEGVAAGVAAGPSPQGGCLVVGGTWRARSVALFDGSNLRSSLTLPGTCSTSPPPRPQTRERRRLRSRIPRSRASRSRRGSR